MTRGKVKIALLVSAFILFFLLVMANRPLVGQENNFETTVKQKLDQILNNQEKIFTQMDVLKAEIIKTRTWDR